MGCLPHFPITLAAIQVHFLFFFILQYGFAMYTRTCHVYINLIEKIIILGPLIINHGTE